MKFGTNKDILKIEDYIRQHFDNFPIDQFINEINSISIDFIREVSDHIDIKRVLWEARPWNIEETLEDHMNYWHSHLKEFWKDMLTDEEYVSKHSVTKSIKQILDNIQ